MSDPIIKNAAICGDCGCFDGHLNTGNVRPARLSGVRFGFAPGAVLCKTCYEKHRYRQVVRPRRKAIP
jgi:cbb3-type cytochrome oxidase subunit 1